jgi:Lon protease-like protein
MKLPRSLRLWPLGNSVLFPGAIVPIRTERLTHWQRLAMAMGKRPMVAIAARRKLDGLYAIGCAAYLLEVRPGPEVIVQGVHRVRLHAAQAPGDGRAPRVRIDALPDTSADFDRRQVEKLQRVGRRVLADAPRDVVRRLDELGVQPAQLVDFITSYSELAVPDKQLLLETLDPIARSLRLLELRDARDRDAHGRNRL